MRRDILVIGWMLGGYVGATTVGLMLGGIGGRSLRQAAIRLGLMAGYAVISGLLGVLLIGPPMGVVSGYSLSLAGIGTCIDPRVEPGAILGVELGDAIVHRVVGGRVTPAVLRDVAYISYLLDTKAPDGPWFELAVIHHTDCGSTFLADPVLRAGFAARGFDEAELAALPATDPPATVRTDVNILVAAPQISPNIRIGGYVYNTAEGTLDTIVTPTPAGTRT